MGHRGQTRGAVPRVAIFGCGRIGSALDEALDERVVLSHAGAVAAHADFDLVALCDPDPRRLAEAGDARGVSARFAAPTQLLSEVQVDVAVLCGPTHTRLTTVQACLKAGVSALVLEKPLAPNLAEAEEIARLVSAHEVVSSVNFLRRFCPPLQSIAAALRAGELGDIQVITAHYGKGLNNNGSHLIDLLRWWIGEVTSVEVLGVVEDDRVGHDATMSVRLGLASDSGEVSAFVFGSDHRHTSLFELDILTTTNRVKLVERGGIIERFGIVDDPTFPGYTTLGLTSRASGDIEVALAHMWQDLAAVFQEPKRTPACTIHDALATLKVVHRANQSSPAASKTTTERSS